jgi:hypothetical protein
MTRNTMCVHYKDQFMLLKEVIAVECENRIKQWSPNGAPWHPRVLQNISNFQGNTELQIAEGGGR